MYYLEHSGMSVREINNEIDALENKGAISDGSHTFDELYYHRMILFSIVCDMYVDSAWKSWKHADGSMYPDYFIVGITTPQGDYSYHYHKKDWDKFNVDEIERAPEWDGHKPEDIERLYSLMGSPGKLDPWLKREIDVACKDECGYGRACYNSAAKAYMSLAKDGHSGFSIMATKSILNRMIMHKPLKPLTGEDDEWGDLIDKRDDFVCYQNKRCSSVFKYVYDDGRVEYHDVDQFRGVDINNNSCFSSGLIAEIGRELRPINMPYAPSNEPIYIYVEDFLCDEKNGDFDTRGIYYMMDGDKKTDINRYFTEDGHDWKEITKDEFLEMKSRRIDRR